MFKKEEEEETDLKGHTGFLLEKLIIKQDKILGKNFEIILCDKQDIIRSNGIVENPYSTVIIGSNGTGKSYILKLIADILLQVEALENGTNVKYTRSLFEISFYNNSEYFIVSNFEENTITKKVLRKKPFLKSINGIEKPYTPASILVTSVLLTDRFTIYRKPSEKYKYLGVRNLSSPSSAGTRNYVKRTVEHIVNALSDSDTELVYKLESLLIFLKFKNTLTIYYSAKYKEHFFRSDLTVDRFKSLFENYKDAEKGFSKRVESQRIPNNIQYYNNHIANNPVLIAEVVGFLVELRTSYLKTNGKSKVEYFEFDVINRELSLDKYSLIKELYALDLISYPSISLTKEEENINLEETSSGEYHFISTMIALFASIKHNSIVLIDEPEVSLHPNWQMKYIHFLKEIFKDYSSSHFIIATHSHFLVSDLPGNTSYISGLKKENNEVLVIPMKQDTYGWSAEQVLLDIFQLPTTRNLFVAEMVGRILALHAKKEFNYKSEINILVEKLKEYNINQLSSGDPLKPIITKIFEKYA